MQARPLILVVDDERDIQGLMKRALESAGYEVIIADDGSQALALIEERNPDVVLLDIKMPGKSGIEILEELRTSHPDIAVIMATGIGDVNIAVDALREGASDYLTKPFNVNELVISVARVLEKQRLILDNRDYQLNLERKVTEQTQLLRQKIRELTALNNLFVTHLNQGFEAAETHDRLAGDIMKMAKEIDGLINQGYDAAETYSRLANDIIKAAESIQALAKEAEARKVEVKDPPMEKAKAGH